MPVNLEVASQGIMVLRPTAGLEMSNVTAFRHTLQEAVQQAERGVVVLLADVTFIDSAGIAVLIEGLRWCRERHLPYILAHLLPAVRLVIELARLENFFTIVETIEEATARIIQSAAG
jgi:anti-sigma B factor antagonist